MNAPHADTSANLLYAVARALFELAACRRVDSFKLPYPPVVQLTLDRVVLDCLRRGAPPPTSLPDLVRRFTTDAASEPPAVMPTGLLPPTAPLINGLTRMPTRTCAELASAGQHGVVEQEAKQRLRELADACPTVESFKACRSLLIANIVIDPQQALALEANPRTHMTWQRVKRLYDTAPAAYTKREMGDRVFARCRRCGFPTSPLPGEWWICESGYCETTEEPDRRPAEGMLLLPASLRLFLALPGNREQAIQQRLAQAGIATTLVPDGLGAYRFTHPAGETGVLQIYDREQPVLLAARLAEEPACSEERRIAVIPDRVISRQPGYLAALAGSMREDSRQIFTSEAALSTIVDPALHEQKAGSDA